jgi:hypothetical protein
MPATIELTGHKDTQCSVRQRRRGSCINRHVFMQERCGLSIRQWMSPDEQGEAIRQWPSFVNLDRSWM